MTHALLFSGRTSVQLEISRHLAPAGETVVHVWFVGLRLLDATRSALIKTSPVTRRKLRAASNDLCHLTRRFGRVRPRAAI